MVIYVDLIVLIVGLVVFLAAGNKADQVGLYAFACGLLALLLAMGTHGVRLP